MSFVESHRDFIVKFANLQDSLGRMLEGLNSDSTTLQDHVKKLTVLVGELCEAVGQLDVCLNEFRQEVIDAIENGGEIV